MKLTLPGYWISLILLIIIVIWLAYGEVESAADQAPEVTEKISNALPKVAYRTLSAENIPRKIVVQGHVEALRSVTLNSRLSTTVEAILVENGSRVTPSTALLKLSEENIPSLVAEANAEVSLARSELKAATSLHQRGMLAETELKTREAALAKAEAMAAEFRRDLQSTLVKAPFAGVVEHRHVEVGEIVQQGSPLVSLLDDSKVKLVGQIAQQRVASLRLGLPVEAVLLSGHILNGKLTFIGYRADPDTRTFRVEAELENPEMARVVGATASLAINSGMVSAHSISPALLTLDARGRLSVEHLSSDDRVQITPVERVQASINELWITGLPKEVRVITLGKGYVAPGQQVQADAEENIVQQGI